MNANNGKRGEVPNDLVLRPRVGRTGTALRMLLIVGLSWVGVAAAADDADPDAQHVANDQPSDWKVGIGLGAVNVPRYPGSRYDYTTIRM